MFVELLKRSHFFALHCFIVNLPYLLLGLLRPQTFKYYKDFLRTIL